MTREHWISTLTVRQLRGMVADIVAHCSEDATERPLYKRLTDEIARREQFIASH